MRRSKVNRVLTRVYNRVMKPWFSINLSGLRVDTRGFTDDTRMTSAVIDHLNDLFFFGSISEPTLMVELGTRGGDSTRVLLSVARMAGAHLLSVDINACGAPDLRTSEFWSFVQSDDVEFGQQGFAEFCRSRNLDATIDFLFIDSSHEYEHSKAELDVWFPYVRRGGIIVLHDTNMASIHRRYGGTIEEGWDNERGVTRALEEKVGISIVEDSLFATATSDFLLIHRPHSSGLTVLQKRR